MELNEYLTRVFEKADAQRASPIPEPAPPLGTRPEPSSPGPVGLPDEAFQKVKKRVHTTLVERLDPNELNKLSEEHRRTELRVLLEKGVAADPYPLSPAQRQAITEELLDEMLGFGPLEPLLRDPTIGDILINGTWALYVERRGILEELPNPFQDTDHLMEVIQRVVTRVGRQVNESSPTVDARLPDGSRFHAVVPPLALNGPLVSIRRFGTRPLLMADLIDHHSLSVEMALFLEAAVRGRLNTIVSGGTGSGKTTLLNALSAYIPAAERILTIEDAAELHLQQRHVARLETRPPNLEGKGEISIRELVRNALRMRPDRIVVGECRGAEAIDMLQAMNTGHDGSLTTLHANNPRDALSRLETMIMMAGLNLPLIAMRHQIAAAVNLIIQIERVPGGARRVTRVTEVLGMEGEVVTLQDLFVYTPTGVDAAGKSVGRFESTGVASHYSAKLRTAGVKLPADLFRQRILCEV
jgi:pilus assembly protein CpaF